jgi:hypothetical protein
MKANSSAESLEDKSHEYSRQLAEVIRAAFEAQSRPAASPVAKED